MMTDSQLTKLIRKYLSDEATEEEKHKVEQWYDSFDESDIDILRNDALDSHESVVWSLKEIRKKIIERQTKKGYLFSAKKKKFSMGYRWAAAAILLLISGSIYFFISNNKRSISLKNIAQKTIKRDILPGGNKAILTLANGQKIVLDSTQKGMLSVPGNTKIVKVDNGLLKYQKSKIIDQKSKIKYNTVTTPRGGVYRVVLPDGSKVWLNASSSIHFPTTFVGKKRKVEITGEAYFEISPDINKPFIVKVNDIKIKVLGTHFNVMAYDNEAEIKTTLLEGAVRVTADSDMLNAPKNRQSVVLKPGQQAIIRKNKDDNKKIILNNNINLNQTVAWKNNLFWFQNTDINEVMKQLSRWYDVDIKMKEKIPDLFTGSIPRNITFSKMFEILQMTGSIHYKIKNKQTVIVTP